MPVLNRIAAFEDDMTEWRRWMHRHPELGFDCFETAAFVTGKLREFGVDEIHDGIAGTGIVALIHGQGEGPVIGLRADMDALPIVEQTGADYASEVPGKMHACGHDGHTAMLLGAARYLAETRNFAGTAALIFQPAEERGGGAKVMVEEGVMDRFGIAQVYAMHNAPQIEAGTFEATPGPIMAAVDEVYVTVTGKGGHAAWPQECIDPIPPLLSLAQAFGTIVSRNADPVDRIVVSVTELHAGTATNIIPSEARLTGTVRTFSPEMRDLAERRMREIAAGHATAFNVEIAIDYNRDYPATVNHDHEAALAADIAAEIVGGDRVDRAARPSMGAEDFAYMLEVRPGAYLNIGQGPGPMCHHPSYDFNDDVAPIGASFFARLVERLQPLR